MAKTAIKNNKKFPKWLITVSVVLVLVNAAILPGCESFGEKTPNAHAFEADVKRIIDGDTIELANDDRVRYIGIDTPEKGQPYYKEAKEANRKLVKGKNVSLEFDVQEKDKYGSLLAYVYVGNIFINTELVKQGYANVYPVPPNVKYSDLLVKLQREARENNRGLWGIEVASDKPYYIGNKRSKVFHQPGCQWVKKISPKNKLIFKSRDEAINKGHRPARGCNP
jgi:micrococcal nuclease